MNYRTLVAIHFKGELEPTTFQPWLEAHQGYPLFIRIKMDTGELWMGLEALTTAQKESCVKQAIQQGLSIELVFKEDDEDVEYSYPFPITQSNHPLLTHDPAGKVGFVRITPERVQICLKDSRGDQLLQWLIQAWERLKVELANHPSDVRERALKFVIKSCATSKDVTKPMPQKIEQTLMNFKELNDYRKKQGKILHEAEMLFYKLPIKEDDFQPLYGGLGSGSCIGLAYIVLLLFNFLEDAPVLQMYALKRLKEDCA